MGLNLVELEGTVENELSAATASGREMSEDEIQEMIVLATRLRAQTGGELDEDAILAVAEATSTPVDWVRLAVRSVGVETKKQTVLDRLKSSYYAFSPEMRSIVMGGTLGLGMGMSWFLSQVFRRDVSGFWDILGVVFGLGALTVSAMSRQARTAIATGALAGAISQLILALFGFVANLIAPWLSAGTGPEAFLAVTVMGAILGAFSHTIFNKNRKKLGFNDPAEDRHKLIQQLMEIQSQLKSDEKFVTFLSVDMVGSTRIKSENDPLSVEYTFNEYHRYVESVAHRHGGRIHSTAGDGVTVVFDDPENAVKGGKALQGGLFEFNAFRNKLGKDVELRAAVHTGNVLAPGKDSTSVNFAQVIDIAAHLQKDAPAGCLLVSEQTAVYVGGMRKIGDEIIETREGKGVVWRPRSRGLAAQMGANPTLKT